MNFFYKIITSVIKNSNLASKKASKKQDSELKEPAENGNDLSRKESLKCLKGHKDPSEKNSKEQRVLLQPIILDFFFPVLYINLLLTLFYIQKEYFEREMEKRFIRTSPLGKDRNYNRYWWLRRDGRIFVESSDSKEWGYYSSKEEVLNADGLLYIHFLYIYKFLVFFSMTCLNSLMH